MVRLTREEQQERTRASVLDAARREFTGHSFAEAKIDRIAERAELTRGAVYSNFPSKRALYLAVLVDMVESPTTDDVSRSSPLSVADALGAFARVWLERMPVRDDTRAAGQLQLRSLAGVLDEPARTALDQVIRLEALLLALALESHADRHAERSGAHVRRVRLAELVLTLLNGSGGLAEVAPGFGDPFDVARACEHLAGIDLGDTWNPAHLPYVRPAESREDVWTPPAILSDQITGHGVDLSHDGLITVLGTSRLAAAEEAVRAAHTGERVTVVVVTNDPAEISRLVRLRLGDMTRCLRRVFPADALPAMRVVLDDRALTAAAIDLPEPNDATEAAVRVADGKVIARAEGSGAAYAAARAGSSTAAHRGSET